MEKLGSLGNYKQQKTNLATLLSSRRSEAKLGERNQRNNQERKNLKQIT